MADISKYNTKEEIENRIQWLKDKIFEESFGTWDLELSNQRHNEIYLLKEKLKELGE